ncbi:hypothetical protein KW796_01070 [Candidatus Parcubacteria bacterium]|nr:hypothetical protein [Candidatus Parcubacteria bacterium]
MSKPMQIVEVIPIVKGITRPTLSYFTKDKFEPGSFVRVPVRSGVTLGIVSTSVDAHKAKSSIKGADFVLRKLSMVEKAGGLSEPFMQAVKDTADFYAVTSGSILSVLVPKIFLEHPELLSKQKKDNKKKQIKELKIVQLGDEERYREYRGIVRECFARSTSAMIVVPTREDALRAESLLSYGIERFVYNITSQSPNKLKKLLKNARDEKHPILVITTPSLVAFDRTDLDTYILEKENSRAYRVLSRPFIHIKNFLKYFTKAKGATLILGDSVLSLETLWREREGEYAEFSPLTWRLKQSAEAEIIDMRVKKNFDILSERLIERIKHSLALNKKVFLFGVRKGVASATICGDCGSLLLCRNCQAPLVLHSEPLYLCHHCGAKRIADTRCDTCQSWKLTPLGLGTDRIALECAKIFPDAEVIVIDKDHASTQSEARSLVRKFEESERAILVGTELALQYIQRVPVVAAVSLDTLFAVPDFYINERIFYLVTRLREAAEEHFILQTRNAGTEILDFAAAGNILDFYRTEIAEREGLSYPPFSIFIKVSADELPEKIEREAAGLQASFGSFNPHFRLETRGKGGKQTLSMILRQPGDRWPHKELRDKLLLLPPDFTVKVDPESIL